jgi:hypothetical protein
MEYILIGSVFALCCTVWVLCRYFRSTEKELSQLPLSDVERKLLFIHDVCDGHLQKAEALLSEKRAIDETLTHEQAVDQVYLDMLALTADERGESRVNARAA